MLLTSEKNNGVSSDEYKSEYLPTTKPDSIKNGYCSRNGNITVPQNTPKKLKEEFEETPLIIALTVYFCYAVLMIYGHVRDFMRKVGLEKNRMAKEKNREGYVPLYQSFESFYTRNIYRRICHCFNMPICSLPGATVRLLKRVTNDYNWSFKVKDESFECINMGSYNYLGFSSNIGPTVDSVENIIKEYGIGICSSRHELGTLDVHIKLEQLVAKFLGVDDSIIVGMGFATNSTSIPTLISKGSLILSDELNHASLVLGCRLSGAKIRVFKHNSMKDLEKKIRTAIIGGQPRTHRPWKKIIIIVEGLYSMEGTIVNLPEIIALKKKYKCYLYVDEAHSIGAIGPTGRGVTDYFGCNPQDIDIFMGTFTKSFGASGGYIAGSTKLINHLRIHCHSFLHATSMSAPIVEQIYRTLKTIMGLDGTDEGMKRIHQLKRNTVYFRRKLKQKGFIIYGNEDSPIVPLMLYFPSKITAFVEHLLKHEIATVGVGFPATSLLTARARFCISGAHTKEMLDKAIYGIETTGRLIMVDYSKKKRSQEEVIY